MLHHLDLLIPIRAGSDAPIIPILNVAVTGPTPWGSSLFYGRDATLSMVDSLRWYCLPTRRHPASLLSTVGEMSEGVDCVASKPIKLATTREAVARVRERASPFAKPFDWIEGARYDMG